MKQPNEQAIKELEVLTESNGGLLDPQHIVAKAEKPTSALHDYFEWDEVLAAHEYRLEQARQLIRIWVVMLPQKPSQLVRMCVSLADDRGKGGYRKLTDVLGDAELRTMLLKEAKRDMSFFRRKYAMLVELAKVVDAMDLVE